MELRLSHDSPDIAEPHNEIGILVAQAAGGDEDAWRELVLRYSPRIFAMARSRLRNDDMAEEITQSVFVTIATKLRDQQYAETGRFEPWLFRITMNRVRDVCRAKARHAKPVDPVMFQSSMSEKEMSTSDETPELNTLRMAMSMLSESDRELIELRHHGQMSFKQIAELLAQPVGTLLARHHRALKKLRTFMDQAQKSPHLESGETS